MVYFLMAKKKITRKTTRKTVTPRTSSPQSRNDVTTSRPSPSTELKDKLNKNNRALFTGILVIVLILVAAFAVYRKSIAAYVNGEPISKMQVISELEKQNGKTVLNQLITEKLIQQEAKKRNITVTQADINKELKTVEASLSSQGMSIDQALQAQGMTRKQLEDQVRIQLLVQKMVKTPTVSDNEVQAYITQNQDQITPEQQDQPNFNSQIRTQLQQQKQQTAIQKFISDLQTKAKIQTLAQY